MIGQVTMPPSPALDKNSAPAAARAPAQGSRAEPDEQWKRVVCVSGCGVWDGTEQLRVKIFNWCATCYSSLVRNGNKSHGALRPRRQHPPHGTTHSLHVQTKTAN